MKSEWYETFFEGPAVEFWTRAIPPAMTLADADFLEKTLAPDGPARLLDIPCGNGRHALELARRGHTLTGFDLSPEFLDAARTSARTAGAVIEWLHGDMRNPVLPAAAFDGAYCFGNSFCYLNRTDAEAFLKAVATALRPGGKLAIATGAAAESILPTLLPQRWHRTGDLFVLSACRYVAEYSRLDIDYTFIKEGVAETRATCSYVMTTQGLRELLASAGFEVVSMHAGVAGEPYAVGSPGLILTARVCRESVL